MLIIIIWKLFIQNTIDLLPFLSDIFSIDDTALEQRTRHDIAWARSTSSLYSLNIVFMISFQLWSYRLKSVNKTNKVFLRSINLNLSRNYEWLFRIIQRCNLWSAILIMVHGVWWCWRLVKTAFCVYWQYPNRIF